MSDRDIRAHISDLQAACSTNADSDACLLLGELYVGGLGVARDARRGYRYLLRAARGGHCCASAEVAAALELRSRDAPRCASRETLAGPICARGVPGGHVRNGSVDVGGTARTPQCPARASHVRTCRGGRLRGSRLHDRGPVAPRQRGTSGPANGDLMASHCAASRRAKGGRPARRGSPCRLGRQAGSFKRGEARESSHRGGVRSRVGSHRIRCAKASRSSVLRRRRGSSVLARRQPSCSQRSVGRWR